MHVKIDSTVTAETPLAIDITAGAVTNGPIVIEFCEKCGCLYVDHYTATNHPCHPTARWKRHARMLRRRATGK